MPMVVIKTCERLGVPGEALNMMADPVKYGLFPMKKAMEALLLSCASRLDVEGL